MSALTIALAILLVAQMVLRHVGERSWAKERAELVQRIQAPERAVFAYARPEPEPAPPPIAADDDEAWKKRKDRIDGAG